MRSSRSSPSGPYASPLTPPAPPPPMLLHGFLRCVPSMSSSRGSRTTSGVPRSYARADGGTSKRRGRGASVAVGVDGGRGSSEARTVRRDRSQRSDSWLTHTSIWLFYAADFCVPPLIQLKAGLVILHKICSRSLRKGGGGLSVVKTALGTSSTNLAGNSQPERVLHHHHRDGSC